MCVVWVSRITCDQQITSVTSFRASVATHHASLNGGDVTDFAKLYMKHSPQTCDR